MFGQDGPTLRELIRQSLVSTQQGYDMLAPKFDATPFRTPDAVLGPAVETMGMVDSAIDLCCGTGAAMRLMKAHCQTRLTGIDFSAGMLEQARTKMQHVSGAHPRLEFIEGNIFEMPFKEEFDVATCFGALGHILPKEENLFIRKVRTVLKPGGRFIFVTGRHPPMFSWPSAVYRTFNFMMHIRNALIKPAFIMYYFTFMLPEILGKLEQEGFAAEVRDNVFLQPFSGGSVVIATRKE
jgi:ubiquinone/menaquinone biosynthesis C-methylase UbiE